MSETPEATGTVEETPAATPVETPAADAQAQETTEETPETYEFGDDERKAARQVHRNVRELDRTSKAIENRQAELAKVEEELAARQAQLQTPATEETDLLGVEDPTNRMLQQILDGQKLSAQERQELRGRLDAMQEAEVQATRQELEQGLETSLRQLTDSARATLMPNLEGRSAVRADKAVWGEFQERLAEFHESNADPNAFTEEKLQELVGQSVLAVREDYTGMGYAQLAANRTAAAEQPVALAGTPAEPGPKKFEDMTPEEQDEYQTTEARKIFQKAGLNFTPGVGRTK